MGCPLQKKLILTRISHLVCVWVSCLGRLTLCDLTDCRPPSSAVHVDSQGKNTGVVAMPSFRGSSQSRDQTCVFCLLHRQVGSLALAPPGNSISQNAKYKIKKKKKKPGKKISVTLRKAEFFKMTPKALSTEKNKLNSYVFKALCYLNDTVRRMKPQVT